MPVVDTDGAPAGMVSEGDLIGRDETSREARRDWWLTLLAEGETIDAGYVASLRAPERTARDVMARPVVTVGEETEISEVARLLTAHRIKRVPVLRDGRIVGIVSRADLVRALAAQEPRPTAAGEGGMLAETFAGLDHRFFHRQPPAERPGPSRADPWDRTTPRRRRRIFAAWMADHEHQKLEHLQELRRAAVEQRQASSGGADRPPHFR